MRKFILVLLCYGLAAEAVIAQQKPNIIFILADDLGYYSLGAFGQKLIKTPNLDKLAANGMTFTNFYSNQMCSPSRGSLLTGMHQGHGLIRGNHELGGYADSLEYGQMPLQANMQTMGTELQKAGYVTAVTGKWGVGGPNSTGVPNLQGIDFFYGYLDQKQAQNYYPTHLWRNEVREPLPNTYVSVHPKNIKINDPNDPGSYAVYKGKVYSADTIHRETLKFIEAHKDKPFFLEMAYTLPHMALQVPDRALAQYKGKFDDKPYLAEKGYIPNQYPRATYAAMISLLDSYVGEVVALLKKHGLDKNTLIVFTGDNGAAKVGGCDPDYFGCSGTLRGRKGTIYEGGIKEPFIACWPGVIKPGTTSGHLSAIWDLMPTFLDAAGVKHVKGIDGVSFLPTLKQQGAQQQHEFLYWERHGKNGKSMHEQAVRFGDWKALKITGNNQVKIELYNLKQDMSEKNNVAKQHPDLVRKAEACFQTRRLAVIPEWNFGEPTEDN
ncbi:arylsulfatase [Pedobacter sp. BS3]|uniref:arylsulfatase n=1 Tax=Pedobacter sp. BS3 TaxID=2567937 RepID=UPI0011EEF978|nr:arylsulfatase [Pedobacter sp. BS3]TZF84064.1 arylsulfatase [Pedobacter sp. BS3]